MDRVLIIRALVCTCQWCWRLRWSGKSTHTSPGGQRFCPDFAGLSARCYCCRFSTSNLCGGDFTRSADCCAACQLIVSGMGAAPGEFCRSSFCLAAPSGLVLGFFLTLDLVMNACLRPSVELARNWLVSEACGALLVMPGEPGLLYSHGGVSTALSLDSGPCFGQSRLRLYCCSLFRKYFSLYPGMEAGRLY